MASPTSVKQAWDILRHTARGSARDRTANWVQPVPRSHHRLTLRGSTLHRRALQLLGFLGKLTSTVMKQFKQNVSENVSWREVHVHARAGVCVGGGGQGLRSGKINLWNFSICFWLFFNYFIKIK